MRESVSLKHKEVLPLDARLLADAVIELNISRRNVAIYPKGHSLVEKSLNKSFNFLRELFELRSEITLAVAKDVLIVDDRNLDKKNPVFREFALCLNKNNIASVTFANGLSREDIYEFHRFLSDEVKHHSRESLKEILIDYKMAHIDIEFIDYRVFSCEEVRKDQEVSDGNIWEDYIFGLVNDSLSTGEGEDVPLRETVSNLANLVTKVDYLKEDTYDKVISSYLRRSSENQYSGSDLKKITNYIDGLRPEVKKQFLNSTLNNISKGTDTDHKRIIEESVDEVIELLRVINEQVDAIPDALRNVLHKLSLLSANCNAVLTHKDEVSSIKQENIADDILVSPDIINLIRGSHFNKYVSNDYQHQINQLLKFDTAAHRVKIPEAIKGELSDKSIEIGFHQTILELITSGVRCSIPPKDHKYFIMLLKEQADDFAHNCSYGQIFNIVNVFKEEVQENDVQGIGFYVLQYIDSKQFINLLVKSFRMMDRKSLADAMLLCEYYGQDIVPPLIDTLIEENEQKSRRILIDLISHLGNKAYSELVSHLNNDDRWFVKRNMLYILGKFAYKEVAEVVKPYTVNENPKVRFQAIKILLYIVDDYAITALRDLLKSKDRGTFIQAIELSGLFKVKEIVPDLILLLKKKGRTGVDISNKIPIVKALGMIKDPRAIEVLRGLLSAKSFLFKSELQKLKEEIYLALENIQEGQD